MAKKRGSDVFFPGGWGTDPTAQLRSLSAAVSRIESQLRVLIRNQGASMAKLDDILADVEAETTAVDSVSQLIKGLRDQIAAAAGDQAKIDAIFAKLEANKAALAEALAANVAAGSAPKKGAKKKASAKKK